MVHGIGVDIVEIERFAMVLCRRGERFLKRVFTEAELVIVNGNNHLKRSRAASLAGRFAAKEAVIKAMGGRAPGFIWQDIEVGKDGSGAPSILLRGVTAQRAKESGITGVLVSISHSRDYAVAYVLAIKSP